MTNINKRDRERKREGEKERKREHIKRNIATLERESVWIGSEREGEKKKEIVRKRDINKDI